MLLCLYQENLEAKQRGERPPHTLLIVTHELNEAIYVGDRVVGLSQYWKWEDEGHTACPGATVVYDSVAPVFHPDEPRDFGVFAEQRQEIRLATFSAEVRQPRQKYVRFWDEVKAGKGQGILAP